MSRTALPQVLDGDEAVSDTLFKGSLVLLPGVEQVLAERASWSEEKNINPYVVKKPEATVEIASNVGRLSLFCRRLHGTALLSIRWEGYTS